jgi:hypothetical protein
MKNRDKYIVSRNEYDLMTAIEENTGICPIRAISGISKENKVTRCTKYAKAGCKECIQDFLNEES